MDSSGDDSQPWFALRVRSNCERVVASGLKGKGYAEFSPLYRKHSRRPSPAHLPPFLFPDSETWREVISIASLKDTTSTRSAPEGNQATRGWQNEVTRFEEGLRFNSDARRDKTLDGE